MVAELGLEPGWPDSKALLGSSPPTSQEMRWVDGHTGDAKERVRMASGWQMNQAGPGWLNGP